MTLTPAAAPPWELATISGGSMGLDATGDLASHLALVLAWALVLTLSVQTLLTGWFYLQVRGLLHQRQRWPE